MKSPHYEFAGLRFDPADGQLERLDGRSGVQLRPQVARLLTVFLEQPETLLGREQLVRAVWDEGAVVDFESGLAAVLRELRAELKSLAGADDLIETVPRRGYRLRTPVQRGASADGFSRAGRKRLIGLSVALAMLLVAVVLFWPDERELLGPESPGQTLAVLPFSQFGEPVSGPARLDLLLADQMLVQLWDRQPEGIILIGRASMAPYERDDDLAAAVAADLAVDLLIEGSVVFESERVIVSARLLEMPGGRIRWSQQFEYAQDEMPSVGGLASDLAQSMIQAWQVPD